MEISIENPQQRFDDHLKLPGNNRVIFSGAFGTGKSHFLKEYFESKEDKYDIYWVSPVDYVLGSTQDIFEWIKVDIAKQLLLRIGVGGKEKTKDDSLFQNFLFNNANDIVLFLVNESIKLKTGIDGLDFLKKYSDKYNQFKENSKKELLSHSEVLTKYVEENTKIKGSIFEDDILTQIIRAQIKHVSESIGKQSILVIEDLDRLDPEHIFRILNIFSSHDNHFGNNKFGFDRVILVCHLKNIEHIFRHKYGALCDFEGFIEKFYTYYPFEFTIRSAIAQFCQEKALVDFLDDSNRVVLGLLLAKLIENDKLNIRNISKLDRISIAKYINYRKEVDLVRGSLLRYVNSYGVYIDADSLILDYGKHKFINVVYLLVLASGGVERLQSSLKVIKQDKKIIAKEHVHDVIDATGVLYHLLQNENSEISKFVFSNAANDGYNHPIIKMFGLEFPITLKWSTNCQYQGGDYFELVNNKALSNRFSSYAEKKHYEMANYSYLWWLVEKVLQFAEEKSIFENI